MSLQTPLVPCFGQPPKVELTYHPIRSDLVGYSVLPGITLLMPRNFSAEVASSEPPSRDPVCTFLITVHSVCKCLASYLQYVGPFLGLVHV